MKYRLVIFDFDGTLADSFPFFLKNFGELARRHGFASIDPECADAFRSFTPRRMMAHVGMPAWKLPFVARDFVALMRDDIAAVQLFAGIPDLTHHLVSRGVKLAVVSSNSLENVRTVLGPNIAGTISHYECGMSIFGKASRITKTLRNVSIPPDQAIYVGDQVTDLRASRRAGVAFGAVAWGYGSIESLVEHSPDVVFRTVTEIERLA